MSSRDRCIVIGDRGAMIEDGGMLIEDRGATIEDRGAMIEDGGMLIEDRGATIEDRGAGHFCPQRRSILWNASQLVSQPVVTTSDRSEKNSSVSQQETH